MVLIRGDHSLDNFFDELLITALKRRGIDVSKEAREHVTGVLVDFTRFPEKDETTSNPQATLSHEETVYVRQTYEAAQKDPQKLLALGDSCLFRVGSCYGDAGYDRHNPYNPKTYARIGAASYARVCELLIDYGTSDVATPFLELSQKFWPISISLGDISINSLTNTQRLELYGFLKDARDLRCTDLFNEGVTMRNVTKKIYVGPSGASDNN